MRTGHGEGRFTRLGRVDWMEGEFCIPKGRAAAGLWKVKETA